MENGYAICMNQWALDKDIKNELGLLLIISSLCAEKGYCFASNKYLAELFNTNETLISRKLRLLEEKKYIYMEYEKVGTQVVKRYIRLSKTIMDDYLKRYPSVIENDKYNITSNNITSNNKYIKKTAYGNYKRIKLTNQEYDKLVEEYGKEYIDIQIQLLDNYVESNNNKNKYTNFYLVLLKSIKNDWFKNKDKKLPDWFNQEIKKEDISAEDKKYMEDLIKSI